VFPAVQELIGVFPLDLPPQSFETVGFWIEIEPVLKNFVEQKGRHFMGGIHAIEHAAIGIFPLFALCDRNDLGGICYPFHPQVGKSAIFIYDAYPGGVGLAQRGFDIIADLIEKTLNHVKTCECEEGCPSCIHSPKCGSGNKPLDKQAAIMILEGLLGYIPLSTISKSDQENQVAYVQPVDDIVAEESKEPRLIFFDLETQKTAQDVGGWQNSHLMRISVAVIFDSVEKQFHAFDESGINDLLDLLNKADLIIGFNVKKFDYRVLGAYTNSGLNALPTFDILEDIHKRLGYRLSLDHLAKETLNKGKTAHGLQAVEWFRQGEIKKLTEYCRRDVLITRDLFMYGLEQGHLVYKEKSHNTRVGFLLTGTLMIWSGHEYLR